MQIADYSVVEELYQSRNSVVYRGERQTDRKPVILKLLNREYPSPLEIALFRREYDILNDLHIKGVVKVLSLESFDNTMFLVMEDVKNSRSLKH
ncbi:MAG: hypothetical protein GY749_06710 [Desulfobacteraceae bacterium]|nr:hypothetical protein [Desulfobacteraceae bacterium]